ncbi:hypothetical protein VNI00_007050 [Paramarasmius palmivorus]|uniref:DUF6535 domain-containing protein n=1 Tax=Paramarasmius palmivorus TaxID=297713 RepID=A0AAW0D113_9AGAR
MSSVHPPPKIPLPASAHGSIQEDLPPNTMPREWKPTPSLDESYNTLLREVSRYDEDSVKNWRDDIDTLLVFAGLFSAVVTAFVVESYQWLSEDPTDTAVGLLMQISMQLNASQIVVERPPFKADSSSIRINCLWFLSLIFSLTSALFGLLCKQWVREHQRDTQTRTQGEELALRQLRRDSFERWGVSSFLSALPILLEAALLLFFAGILDLLWNRNHIPFAFCFIAVILSTGLYFLTTFLPTLTIPGEQWDEFYDNNFDKLSYQFICPFKSPQAWVVYHLSCKVLHGLSKLPIIPQTLRSSASRLYDRIGNIAADWSSFDLRVVRGFDEHLRPFTDSDPFNLKVYELRALEWAVTLLRDSPSMIPHLQNVLSTIPPSVAMSAVFGEWKYAMWGDVPPADVELRLGDPKAFVDSQMEGLGRYIETAPWPTVSEPALHDADRIKLLFYHQYWMAITHRFEQPSYYLNIGSQQASLQKSTGLRFVIPFPVVDALWMHEVPNVQKESLKLLSFFEDAWSTQWPGYDEGRHNRERLAFVLALSRHINTTSRVSILLTSSRGQRFIRFIHNQIISRRLYEPTDLLGPEVLMLEWTKSIIRTRNVGRLPQDYFPDIPLAGSRSNLTSFQPAGIHYSAETVHSTHPDNPAPVTSKNAAVISDATTPGGRRTPATANNGMTRDSVMPGNAAGAGSADSHA